MKKLCFIFGLCLMARVAAIAQAATPAAAVQTLVIKDTLHYYLNKYYFKNGRTKDSAASLLPNYGYPSYTCDASALSTFTDISYVVSRFEVPAGESVTVTGVEVAVAKVKQTTNLLFPIRLYLLKLNASGLPVLPAVDSVTVMLTNANLSLLGADFTNTTPSVVAARTMTGSFAVAARNVSIDSGDLARFFMTNGATTANQLPQFWYGEGNSFVYYQGAFHSTTNFSSANFGASTDYEFMIAPRVTYTAQVSQQLPDHPHKVVLSDDTAVPDTFCTRTPLTFVNTSSKFFGHRMYNLNAFISKWNQYNYPLSDPDPGSPPRVMINGADSAIGWYFEMLDFPGIEPRRYAPYSQPDGPVTVTSALAYYPYCFTSNQFRIRYKGMGAFGRGARVAVDQDMTICMMYCDGDEVGVTGTQHYEQLKLYPNPAMNGKTTISGMKEKNTITVFNLLGGVMYTEVTTQPSMELDLGRFAKGTYLVRISNSNNESKMVRILNP